MTNRKHIVAMVILAVTGLAAAAVSQRVPVAPPRDSTDAHHLPVTVLRLQEVESYRARRSFSGKVVAVRESELSFERNGKIRKLSVDQGQRVVAGQVLAELDDRRLCVSRRRLDAEYAEAEAVLAEMLAGPRPQVIDAARARVDEVRADLSLLRKQKERREGLLSQQVIPPEELETLSAGVWAGEARVTVAEKELDLLLEGTRGEQVAAQRARLAQLRARLDDIEVELSEGVLTAPYAGTIVERRVDEGKVVTSADSVLRIVEDGALEVHIGLPVAIVRRLDVSEVYSVRVADVEFSARVTAVLPELDPATRTQMVILALEGDAAGRALPRQLARLELDETIDENGFWLPTTALVKGVRGLWSCYVVAPPPAMGTEADDNSELRVERRDVETLHVETDRVLVRGTLASGEQVVSEGVHRIVVGQRVRVVDPSVQVVQAKAGI